MAYLCLSSNAWGKASTEQGARARCADNHSYGKLTEWIMFELPAGLDHYWVNDMGGITRTAQETPQPVPVACKLRGKIYRGDKARQVLAAPRAV